MHSYLRHKLLEAAQSGRPGVENLIYMVSDIR